MPVGLGLLLYAVLLIHPIPLPFLGTQVRNAVVAAMPPGTELELGDMALALEGFAWPVLQFSPVTYKDNVAGGKVEMDALEIGFSPIRALIGQPGASITMVGPHIQINQDIFGPRLANFEVVEDPEGGPSTVRIMEGTAGFPEVGFSANGIQISGDNSAKVRSDNDWLIYNLEAAQTGIAQIIEQAQLGRFSRFILKRGTLQMNDAIYGTLRTFNDISFDIAPTPDGKVAEGLFSTEYGGSVMQGILERVIDDQGNARLKASISNFNLPKFLPSSDSEAAAGVGLDGSMAVSVDVGFAADTGKIIDGKFHVDLTGMSVVAGPDVIPIATSIMAVDWQPHEGIFTLPETNITIGQTTAKFHGVFVLGLDDLYGPTVGISVAGRDVRVHPNDMDAPAEGFDMSFKGWSAPLYGALGIDQTIFTKPGARIEARGRIDSVRKGMGVDLTVAGQGLTADDLKRLWPYFAGKEARDWFVKNVSSGVIDSANMKFDLPVGSIPEDTSQFKLPDNSVFMEMVASGVTVQAVDSLEPIKVRGKTRLQVHDNEFTMAGQDGTIVTDRGNIEIANAAMVYGPNGADESLFEISGNMSGQIPALIAAVDKIQPGALKAQDIPIDPASLAGTLNVGLVATTALDNKGAVKSTEYSVNGNVQDFGSTAQVEGHTINNGQLSFMATQAGYSVGGQAMVDGLTANVSINGQVTDATPQMVLSADVGVADLKKFGFDASPFMSGNVGFIAKPGADGTIEIGLDLTQTGLDIKDLGITKAAGTKGALRATIKQDGDVSTISGVDLGFGDVLLKGGMVYDAKKGLQSATFTDFALSAGDSAQISLSPIADGYKIKVTGEQLDLKPMLKRFFGTGGTGSSPAATSGGADAAKPQFTQAIIADVNLKRAMGFYKTNLVNLDASFDIKGEDMRKVSVQSQLSNGTSLSVTTNPVDDGRTMIVAFNDIGSLLRLVGVYAQVEGGSGTLVMQTKTAQKVDIGEFTLKNFAIVDEEKVAEILSSHSESRKLIADRNKLAFKSAKIDFVRRADSIQVTEGLLSGETVGGTIKGNVYTAENRLDLVGTYVPMFGVNNAFARMFGPLGGNRNEGLFGVSFAVKGPIDKPDVRINPLSALVPGAFRSLFDFRSRSDN